MKIPLTAALIWALFSASALASDSYRCVSDRVTGFVFDKARKEWRSAEFKPDHTYVIGKTTRQGYLWEVKESGEKEPLIYCPRDFNEFGSFHCSGATTEFRMNKDNGRFLRAYLVGYWTDETAATKSDRIDLLEEGKYTPFLEIGKCSAM